MPTLTSKEMTIEVHFGADFYTILQDLSNEGLTKLGAAQRLGYSREHFTRTVLPKWDPDKQLEWESQESFSKRGAAALWDNEPVYPVDRHTMEIIVDALNEEDSIADVSRRLNISRDVIKKSYTLYNKYGDAGFDMTRRELASINPDGDGQ